MAAFGSMHFPTNTLRAFAFILLFFCGNLAVLADDFPALGGELRSKKSKYITPVRLKDGVQNTYTNDSNKSDEKKAQKPFPTCEKSGWFASSEAYGFSFGYAKRNPCENSQEKYLENLP